MTCLIRRSSPVTTSRPPFAWSATWTPSFVACSRTIETPRSSASCSENGATCSSTWPASTLDRSRTSLMSGQQVVPRGEDVVEVLLLLRVDLAGDPLAEHLGEADDRVQRRPQLVGHVGQELRLVLAGRLELLVETLELVVHPVHVRRQRTQLVAVGDVHVPREVPGGDRGQPGVDPLDRPDHRPREDEPQQQREDDRPAATPMNRLRECSYALAFWAMRASALAVVAFASSVA